MSGGPAAPSALRRVAKADPDGYTLLLHHIGQATSASLYRKLPYKPGEAFDAIGLVTDVPMTIVARSDFAPTSVGELIEYIKTNKDQVTLANAGIGSASHLCGMLLMDALDTPMTTVPYKGTGPAMTDLMGGQVDLMCDQTTNTSEPDQVRQDQGICGHHEGAGTFPARPADSRFVRPAGLRGRRLARPLRASGHAARGVDKVGGGAAGGAGRPEGGRAVRRSRHRAGNQQDQATPAALDAHLQGELARWQPIIEAAGVYAD